MLSANVQAYVCCRECKEVLVFCPTCGELHGLLPANRPKQLPITSGFSCDSCDTYISVQILGYRPNPTGEQAITSSPLSDRLPSLERAMALPAANKRPAVKATPRPRINQGRSPNPAPRRSLTEWAALGRNPLPRPTEPVSVAATYRRLYGCNPPRVRGVLQYTQDELQSITNRLDFGF